MTTQNFSWKVINACALVLFISFNAWVRYKENIVSDDTLMQIASAQAWRHGHGVSILFADTSDIARVAPRAVAFWPPGYAVLAGLILKATDSVRSVNLSVDIAGLILFFTGWYLIATRLIPYTVPYFPAVLMLPWAFGYMIGTLPTTDLLAMASYVFSMGCLVEWTASERTRARAFWLALCAVTAFGACLIRFAYYPTAFVPAGIVLLGAFIGNKTWWRPGLSLLGLTALLVGGLVLYQHFIAGSLNYVTERHAAAKPQIHWYNLRQAAPFLTKAIPGATRSPLSEGKTDLLLLAGLLAGSFVIARNAWRLTGKLRQVLYVWLGVSWVSFGLNGLVMVLLSLRYPPEKWGPWTYVQEVRYFGINMAIAGSLVMFLLFWKNTAWPKYVRYGLRAVALIIFVHAYAFASFKRAALAQVAPNEPINASAVMEHWVRKSPGRVVLATDQVHNYWGNGDPVASMAMYGAIGGASICRIEHVLRSRYRSQPVTVLVALVSGPPAGLEQLYLEGKAQPVDTIGNGIPLMRLSLPPTAPAAAAPVPGVNTLTP